MSLPTHVWRYAGLGEFLWAEEGVAAEVSRPFEYKETASWEINFRTIENGKPSKHLHQTRLNMLASETKTRLANKMAKIRGMEDLPWGNIIETLSVLTLRHMREGDPVEEIWTDEEIEPPSYLIHPVIAKDQPSIIYGQGGSGKSEMALVLGMIAQLPYTDNKLRLKVNNKVNNVLFLDYETEKKELTWRAKMLRNGFGLPHFSIKYMRGTRPLTDCLDQIQRRLLEHNIDFLVVDSLAPACGAQDLSPSTAANEYFAAVRTLHTTSLTVAHAKKPDGENKDTSVYGSIFFTNLCRSVWECKSIQEEGSNVIDLALFHRKVNMSGKFEPLAYKITFESGHTRVESQEIVDIPELEEGLPLPKRIQNILKKNGALSLPQLEEKLTIDKKKISISLTRLSKRGIVDNFAGQWHLIDRVHTSGSHPESYGARE